MGIAGAQGVGIRGACSRLRGFLSEGAEEEGGGDEADHTRGEVGVGADDLAGGAADCCGDKEQCEKPIDGRSSFGAENAKSCRNNGSKERCDYKTVEKMVGQTAPGALIQRGDPEEDGRIKSELSDYIAEAGDQRVGDEPADGLRSVQAGVVVLAKSGAAKGDDGRGKEEKNVPQMRPGCKLRS